MKKLLNKKGSALVWALIVVSVLFVTIAGIITLCTVYHQNATLAIKENRHRYVIRSAIELVANEITNGNTDFIPVINKSVTAELSFENTDCNVIITKLTKQIRIYAQVIDSTEKFAMGGVMELDGGAWKLTAFTDV